MSSFQPLKVVDRGSGTQTQGVENLNKQFSRIWVNMFINTITRLK